jgi:hypothetical protein
LAALVAVAIPVCRQAERECPRTGPGRKPEIADWVMAILIMVAVMKRRKSKSAQYRFLDQHRRQLMQWLAIDRFPSRTTYFDRYRRAHRLYQQAIRIEGSRAVAHGLADPRCLAVDQSVVRARGPRWNERHVKRKRVPQGADREATWTYSGYHGWVLGYSYEVVVTADKQGTVWPLLASANPANTHPTHTFPDKISQLPKATRFVLADAGYDSNAFAEAIEYDSDDHRTGRRYLCPQIYRRGERRRPKHPRVEKGSRKIRRQRRDQRRCYFETAHGQRLFARRSQTVEPFNQWLKSAFDLGDHAWHRGLQNNQTQLMAAIFCYQILLRYNRTHGHQNGQIQWILDQL